MMKWLVLFCLVQVLMAFPERPRQKDVEKFRAFLKKTQETRNETLAEAMTKNPLGTPWENSGKFQGDILLMDEQVDALVDDYANPGAKPKNGLVAAVHRWPGRTIHYDYATNHFNAEQIRMIEDVAAWFQRNTCVRWVRRQRQNAYAMISAFPTGCFATTGYWSHHIHTLNLAPELCMSRYIILHQMMHVAGFHHMHSTYTRDEWVRVNMANVERGREFFLQLFPSSMVTLFRTEYEYASIMHYGRYAWSANGRPTIEALRSGGEYMGQTRFITAGDTLRLRRMYNCPGAFDVTLTEKELNKPMSEQFRVKFDEAATKANTQGQVNDEK